MMATFDHTVSILVKAYLNDTLEPGNCCACAVGNLMANAVSAEIYEPVESTSCSRLKWRHPEYTGGEWYISPRSPKATGLIQITGYTFDQVWMIERAFEKHRRNEWIANDDIMFNGLMSVIDVLAEIHNIDLTQNEQYKHILRSPLTPEA